MKLTKFSVDHATTIYVLIVIIIIGGLISYFRLPREAAPDIAIPIVIVSTPYFGVSPADIETLVTDELEQEFKGLRNLKKMTSTSAESVSLITLEFEPDVDIEEALQKVRDKVDKARPDLPPDAEEPEIIEINASDWPVMVANVSGDMDPLRLKEFAEDLQEALEKIPGVLRVDLAGGVEREIQVLAEPVLLQHHKVSLNDLIHALQSENVNLPGGSIDIGSMKYTVRVPGEFDNVQMIEDLVVKSPGGQPVYVRDVARVVDGFEEASTISRLSTWTERGGERTLVTQTNVSLAIVKRAGENIIDIADAAREVIASTQEQVPEGVEIVILNDMSEMIKATVHDLENNIISGLILVLAVLFFFMGGARNAAFVAISVPMSMLLTFLVLSMLGITLNMVVLFSLILALGMLVDNAIVIVENIYRHASEGKSRMQAALTGTTEVGWAVVASTATTVAAFFPMLFWPGVTGEFMGYLPLTVIITLIASLFVALVINPTLCATLLRVEEGVTFSENEVPDLAVYRAYRQVLEWSLGHRAVVVVVSILALVGTFMAFRSVQNGVEFFPDTTPDRFQVAVETADGTRLEATDEILRRAELPLDSKPGLVEAWVADSGIKAGQSMGGSGQAPHYGRLTVDLVDIEDQPSDPSEFMEELRRYYSDIAGATITIEREKMGPPAGAPVNVEIVGEDLTVLATLARQIKDRVRPIPGIIDLQDDLELTRPEVHVVVDRARAKIAGVDTRSVAQTVRTAINGTTATVFREGDEEYDIVVRLPEQARASVEDLATLTVVNNDNVHIPLVEVASIQERGGSGSIRHKDQDRVVTVSANAADGYLAAHLLEEVRERVGALEIPAGYSVRYTGENEDQAEAQEFLMLAGLAALFLIVLILVTEFDSILQPVIIMFSVILSLIGVLWSLILTGEPFGIIMTGIGIISLGGVVVNNSIVLIDFANQLRERGLARRDAVLQAGLVRFRPVMLTAITTILGLAPLAVGVSIDFVNLEVVVGGRSVETWGPMARVVASGLFVATILTLIVVPVLYSLLDDAGRQMRRLLFRKAAAAAVLVLCVAVAWPLYAQQTEPEPEPGQAQDVQQEDERTFSTPEDVESSDTLRATKTTLADYDIGQERSLTLDEAIAQVRRDNLDVKIAATRVDAANATIRKAYSTLFPTFSASGSYTINQEEVTVEFADPEQIPIDIGLEPVVVRPKTDYRWSLSASVRANFRAIALLQGAYLQRDIASDRVEALRFALEDAVTEQYYALLTIRSLMELARERHESAQTVLRATKKRVEAGTVNDFELTRARLRAVETEKEMERARLQFLQVREQLARVLDTEANFDVVAPPNPARVESVEALEAQARAERADVRVAEQSARFVDKQIEEVYWRYLPSLSATFTYAGAKDTAFQPGDPFWMLVFGAEWILWDGGVREAEIQELRAQRVAADLEKRRLVGEIGTEIEIAHADYLSSLNQVESGQTQVELAEQALRQARIAYRYGAATQLDVITAEDQLEFARIALIQDQLAVERAVRRLHHLAGR